MGQLEFLMNSKNYPKAAKRLNELVQSNSHDADVWDQYAILYSDGKYDNPLRYHYGLGNEYYVLGNYALAIDQFQTAIKEKPKAFGDDDLQSDASVRLHSAMNNAQQLRQQL
jgi:tetratricopeptide (TPR) repeat protein